MTGEPPCHRPAVLMDEAEHAFVRDLVVSVLGESSAVAGALLDELERAVVRSPGTLPPDVVRLGSWVEFADDLTAETRVVRLTGDLAPIDPGSLSVLSPHGAALFGLRAGDVILWSDRLAPARRIRVLWTAAAPLHLWPTRAS